MNSLCLFSALSDVILTPTNLSFSQLTIESAPACTILYNLPITVLKFLIQILFIKDLKIAYFSITKQWLIAVFTINRLKLVSLDVFGQLLCR